MSAIAGFWSWQGSEWPDQACGRMLSALRAYGPHAHEAWSDAEIAVGRVLFKIHPEDDHDRQPLRCATGRYTLVADVRLDNREELLEKLGQTGDTGSLSDAAILLAAFERWGRSVLDTLLGDFAFAVWDEREKSLFLARDPTGQRPLFYHQSQRFFAFASMPKGLHALEAVPRAPDLEHLADFIGHMPRFGSGTFYKDIARVEPGHFLVVRKNGLRSERYWNPRPKKLGLRSFDDYKEAFRAELDRATGSRIRDQVLIASHLSAGWDSSAVTATAARLLAKKGGTVLAYTSVPREDGLPAPQHRFADEGAIAAAVAARFDNVRHGLIEGSGKSPIGRLDCDLDLFDRPLATLCNNVWLSEIRDQARGAGARVLLTGEMGNWSISASPPTLLADYIREGRWIAWLHEAISIARQRRARLRGIVANSFGPWVPDFAWNLTRRFASRVEPALFTALPEAASRRMEARRDALKSGLARRPKNNFEETLRSIAQYDFGEFRKAAVAGWGIEERDPTADRRLIEFCLSLPVDMLLKDGLRRPLARAALSDRLPPVLLNETRKGYQAADWAEGMSRDLRGIESRVQEIAADPAASTIIDVQLLQMLLRDWPKGGWADQMIIARYRVALLVAISVGHFVVRAQRRPALVEQRVLA